MVTDEGEGGSTVPGEVEGVLKALVVVGENMQVGVGYCVELLWKVEGTEINARRHIEWMDSQGDDDR